jgi:hypothetical protein
VAARLKGAGSNLAGSSTGRTEESQTGKIEEAQIQEGSRRVKYEEDEEVQGSKEQG